MLAKPAYAGRNFSVSFMLGIDRAYHLAAVKGIAQASNFCSAGAPFPSSHVQRWLPDGCWAIQSFCIAHTSCEKRGKEGRKYRVR
jgi:hypothetical protein